MDKTRSVAAIWTLVLAGSLAACSASDVEAPEPERPQQAGQPVDPLRTARLVAGIRLSALAGDQAGVQRNAAALTDDMRRAIKVADASRPIDPEAARRRVRSLPGVRSVVWIDRGNLLVRVDNATLRSQQTIDTLCRRLEPLGDTLAVVVHLQNAAAMRGEDSSALSRNCQLAPGDHALLQPVRQVGTLSPAIREHQRATMERARQQPVEPRTAGDRAALEAIPEL